MYKKTLKPLLFTVILLSFSLVLGAQNKAVSWGSKVNHIEGNLYEVVFTASIQRGFHLYDMGPYEDEYGPNVTVFTFEPSENISLEGGLYYITQPVKEFDKIFGYEVGQFDNRAEFGQKVRLNGERGVLKGEVNWSVCDNVSCMPPEDTDLEVTVTASSTDDVVITAASGAQKGGKSLWGIIIEAILWGFAALLTPCVFPMVPMTVSFFMKGSENKARGRFRAGMYGLFIVLLYTVPIAIIILTTLIVGGEAVTADIFNWLATHWIPNVLFFLVFMVFAASFFGAFEITMPSKLVNRSDRKADKGGLGGIFFMALTLVLVSFSCTGPIVGSVLIKSTQGEFWVPIVTMLAFSVAFALPFTLLALFPSLLNKLPKSGSWLNSVKVVLGFIILAFGLRFLSIADQTYHWGILDREVFLALWIVIFSTLGLYLLGKLKLKLDSDLKYVSVGRLSLAIVVFAFVVYMIPGMWGAPLKGLSGYLPPMTTQDFVLEKYSGSTQTTVSAQAGGTRKYSDFLKPLPYGLDGYFDFNEALDAARRADKPLFVDFTGHACGKCSEMESRVWSDAEVQRIFKEEYIIVALYGDDKKSVPQEDWLTTSNGKVLKGLGKINSYFVNNKFGVNSLPGYIIVGHDGEALMPPRGYDLDIAGYVEFLREGVEKFKNK